MSTAVGFGALRRARATVVGGWHRSVPAARVGAVFQDQTFRLPSFLLIGGMKCGTAASHALLAQHPGLYPARTKETGFFSFRYRRGLEWYKYQFPVPRGSAGLSFEASPFDLFHPLAPIRATLDLPHLKAVALLRNPVDRAISHFAHERHYGRLRHDLDATIDKDLGDGPREFARLAAELDYISRSLITYGIVSRSRYAPQIRRWKAALPPERLLFLRSEDFFANPLAVMRQVFRFLDLDPQVPLSPVRRNAIPKPKITIAQRNRLIDLLAEDLDETCMLLGEAFDWRQDN